MITEQDRLIILGMVSQMPQEVQDTYKKYVEDLKALYATATTDAEKSAFMFAYSIFGVELSKDS